MGMNAGITCLVMFSTRSSSDSDRAAMGGAGRPGDDEGTASGVSAEDGAFAMGRAKNRRRLSDTLWGGFGCGSVLLGALCLSFEGSTGSVGTPPCVGTAKSEGAAGGLLILLNG